MLEPEFGSKIEAVDDVETATAKPRLDKNIETGLYQCCGPHCSCK